MIDEKNLIEEVKSLKVNVTGLRAGKGILREFEKQYRESILRIIEDQPKVGEWIPIKYRETTDDDGIDKNRYPLFLDCKMPDNGQDILICTKGGLIGYDTCFDDDGYYLDSSLDWIDDVVAWMPLPEPYKEG